MDPVTNPYAPGAGTQPPELAGRDDVLRVVDVAVQRSRAGNPARGVLLVGLRGVGKTVLLDRIREGALRRDSLTVRIEAPEERSLPALLAPELRQILLRLRLVDSAKDLALRALRGLAGFVKALRVHYRDLEVGIDVDPEAGLADNGDLEHDLKALFDVVGAALRAADTNLLVLVDELQYVPEPQLGALLTALHFSSQQRLPILFVGAGLPHLPGRLGKAKSYAERLFDFVAIGPLTEDAARLALARPAEALGVHFEPEAMAAVLRATEGYPYFLQEWGKHVWDMASSSPITQADVERAEIGVLAALDAGFFRVRFDRLTPMERRYLRAMAELGPGPTRSGEIAKQLGRAVTSLAPIRDKLVEKGMIWSPRHGETAFSVPGFDRFARRVMPGPDWRST